MSAPTKAERLAAALKAYRDATEPAWKVYKDALRAIEGEA